MGGPRELYSGLAVVQGVVHRPQDKCSGLMRLLGDETYLFVIANGSSLFIEYFMPDKADDTLIFSLMLKQKESWLADEIQPRCRASLRGMLDMLTENHMVGWDARFIELVRAAQSVELRNFYESRPLDEVWQLPTDTTVALVGDSAHPRTPFDGQGCNLGLQDAISLALQLERLLPSTEHSPSAEQAIHAYHSEMISRSSQCVRDVQKLKDFLHSDDAVAQLSAFLAQNSVARSSTASVMSSHNDLCRRPKL